MRLSAASGSVLATESLDSTTGSGTVSALSLQGREHRSFPRGFSSGGKVAHDKPLLVFFTSERSGPARRMESLLAHLARKERTRVHVMRVDVEAQPDLAAKFRVETVPTLVLVNRKRAVDRIVGRASAPAIEAMLARHLEERAAAKTAARLSP
jgi:thioredoxin 1